MVGASATAAILEDVIKRAVVPDLKNRGFRRSGSTFRRSLTGCIHVVNVQAGQRSMTGQFTLNIGVFFPAAHAEVRELLRWDPGRSGPSEPECTVRRRVGTLLGVEDIGGRFLAANATELSTRSGPSFVTSCFLGWTAAPTLESLAAKPRGRRPSHSRSCLAT
jgi:hypothetical protein